MASAVGESLLLSAAFGDEEIAARFSDRQGVEAMLEVETALARAEAGLGLIPAAAAERIGACATPERIDMAALAAGVARDGVPVIALVAALREAVGAEAASYVHWGATSQDVMDTALVLQLRRALADIEPRLERLITRLGALAERHRATVMAGRTHSQQAVPITFGLKVAGWLLPLVRHRRRLDELRPRLLVVQFGGAAGTLAALGDRGLEVMEALARELGLAAAAMPWHTQRDGLAELAGWLALLTGSLAKMAQDVILLAQSEIGELAEGGDAGGSSTMPQKRNPIASEQIVAAARLNAQLLAAMSQAMIQEQERGTHGWQLEWLALPQMAVLTGAALGHALRLAETLAVDEARMAKNISRHNGLILAEAASYALARVMPRAAAHERVREASRRAAREDRHLIEVLRESLEGEPAAAALDWAGLADPARYLGEAERLIDRVLAAARDGHAGEGR